MLNGLELYAVDYYVPPPRVGDINGDGVVDVNDYAILLRHLHGEYPELLRSQTLAVGDLNGDLVVDFHDLVAFRRAYEEVYGAGSLVHALTAVPEPATWVVAALCVVKIRMIRHNRQKVSQLVCASV